MNNIKESKYILDIEDGSIYEVTDIRRDVAGIIYSVIDISGNATKISQYHGEHNIVEVSKSWYDLQVRKYYGEDNSEISKNIQSIKSHKPITINDLSCNVMKVYPQHVYMIGMYKGDKLSYADKMWCVNKDNPSRKTWYLADHIQDSLVLFYIDWKDARQKVMDLNKSRSVTYGIISVDFNSSGTGFDWQTCRDLEYTKKLNK